MHVPAAEVLVLVEVEVYERSSSSIRRYTVLPRHQPAKPSTHQFNSGFFHVDDRRRQDYNFLV